MTLSTDIRAKVQAALATYGATASWEKETKTPNLTGGRVTTVADPNSPYTVRCAPPAPVRIYQDGEVVQTATFKTTIDGDLAFTPAIGDAVSFASTTYRVLRVSPLYGPSSDNVVVAWEAILEA